MTVTQFFALGLLSTFTLSGWICALYWRKECKKLIAQVDGLLDGRLEERRRLTGKP